MASLQSSPVGSAREVEDPGPEVASVGSTGGGPPEGPMEGMSTVVEAAGVVLMKMGVGGEMGVRFCPG